MKPLISVVIPVFNRGWELERALESLKAQSFMDFEVLVCDDGSTEDIETIARSFEAFLNIRYFKMENFGGPARPRNVGIKNAHGEWIAFLDSDDWWDSNRFKLLINHLTDNNDFVYHPLRVVRANDLKRIGDRRKLVGSPFLFDPLKHMALFGNPIPNSSVIVKKSLLEDIGGLSEDIELISVEDFDAWLKICVVAVRFLLGW
jgi:glycosyltransferase involved in cell wall biosynthesis